MCIRDSVSIVASKQEASQGTTKKVTMKNRMSKPIRGSVDIRLDLPILASKKNACRGVFNLKLDIHIKRDLIICCLFQE